MSNLATAWGQIRGYPAVVFLTCLLGWVLSTMDQSLFGYAIPGIRDEFGANLSEVGWVLSISFIFAAFCSSLMGLLTDRFGRRTMFMFALAAAALLVGLHAFVVGLVSLAILRMLAFGISNGLWPIICAFMAEAAPARYRGLLVALIQCGYPIGWFMASLFVVPLIASFGWRYIFLPALFVIPIAFLLVRFLPESKKFRITQAHEAKTDSKSSKAIIPIGKIKELFAPDLMSRTLLLFAVFFLYGGAYAGTAFYFPSYFHEFRGYSMEKATAIVGYSYGMAIIGYVSVAILSEFYITRRNMCIVGFFLGAGAMLGLVWLPTSYIEDVVWFGIMAAVTYGSSAALSVLVSEIFPTRIRATAVGFVGSFALNIGYALFPLAVAYGIENIGWQWAFTLGVAPPLLMCCALLLFLDNIKSGLELDEISV